MASASVSGVVRAASSWLPLLAAVLFGCSNGSSSNPSSRGSAPLIADLQLWSRSVLLNGGGGADAVQFGLVVADPDADVAGVVVTVLDGGGAQVSQVSEPVTNPPDQTTGAISGLAVIPTTTLATYMVEVQAFDSRDNRSNVLRDSVTVIEGNPLPTIAALSPASVPAGTAALTLTVTGTGFVGTSTVTWSGYGLQTTYVDGTTLQAQVESYRLSFSGTAQIAVTNPVPGGGSSAPKTFTIEPPAPNPVPTLASISPTSVDAGGPSFTLTVTGSGFVPSSRVLWNGPYGYLSTKWVDANTLSTTIPQSFIATPGTATVSVMNPTPGGGTSSSLILTVAVPQQPGVTLVSLKANDVAWDPYQRKIYVSVPSVSSVNPNSVTAIDPVSGQVTGSTWVGSEPDRIGVSDDGQFLYVALRGASSVERLTLPDLTPELSIALGRDPSYGAYYALDLQVAPGSPRALAVSLFTSGSLSASGGLVVFDDGTPRPTKAGSTGSWYPYSSLQWGTTASELYAANSSYGYDLYEFAVDATGVVLRDTYRDAFSSSVQFRFDAGTCLVYGDDGRVVDPATGSQIGTYPVTNAYYNHVVPDASLGSAFFVRGEPYGSANATLSVYDLTHFYLTSSSTIAFVGAPPRRPIRWGVDGLAFLTPELVVLVRGSAVLPPSTTPNPVPTVVSLTPSAATAGSPNLVLRVSGTGFVRGSTVLWNGNERATTYLSSTELVGYVPASDLAAAGSAEITVASPAPGGGTSGAATFTVGQ